MGTKLHANGGIVLWECEDSLPSGAPSGAKAPPRGWTGMISGMVTGELFHEQGLKSDPQNDLFSVSAENCIVVLLFFDMNLDLSPIAHIVGYIRRECRHDQLKD
ncbi:hypothetical protein L1887_28543 [Cichorium endivia]|nr:hypothetical protein L1887_28543 [Cichorium endivia]